jgi:UDP-N-acetylglucosamine 2-epimerase (non-hydrolysing)
MKVLLVIGTRPEAIKMAGLVYELRRRPEIAWRLVSTGQHRSMLDETLGDLDIEAHHDLAIMERSKGLCDTAALALEGLDPLLARERPDWILVQGDTTTAMIAGLAGFYHRVRVGHVEAGLRTNNLMSPWPEEANRRLISAIATRHWAPTTTARDNLLREAVPAASIAVTGNTVIDALLNMQRRTREDAALSQALEREFHWLDGRRRMILVTGHRRESFGEGFQQICLALKRIATRGDVEIVYPVHLNPNVREPVHGLLGANPAVRLIEPQRYSRFVYLMSRAHLLLTDSGGIQEEAPSLRKPVLVMRDTSERPEAIEAGTSRIVGTKADSIVSAVAALLDQRDVYSAMSRGANPYGDGKASRRILEDIAK